MISRRKWEEGGGGSAMIQNSGTDHFTGQPCRIHFLSLSSEALPLKSSRKNTLSNEET
jgi:hypothetical protein